MIHLVSVPPSSCLRYSTFTLKSVHYLKNPSTASIIEHSSPTNFHATPDIPQSLHSANSYSPHLSTSSFHLILQPQLAALSPKLQPRNPQRQQWSSTSKHEYFHVIYAYRPRWPLQFATIAAELASDLAFNNVSYISIEHVGSTSVPGLAVKPIIDILLVIAADEFHEIK